MRRRIELMTCCGTGCVAGGAFRLKEALEQEVVRKGLSAEVSVVVTGCNGFCGQGPLLVVMPEKIFYGWLRLEVRGTGRVTHAAAFEPMPPGDPFGDLMNAPKKYVVSKTLERPTWRNTTIIRGEVIESVRALKAQPGKTILTDGSSQLVHALLAGELVDELHLLVYPLTLGNGKRLLPAGLHQTFDLRSVNQYPTGVVGLHYGRPAGAR